MLLSEFFLVIVYAVVSEDLIVDLGKYHKLCMAFTTSEVLGTVNFDRVAGLGFFSIMDSSIRSVSDLTVFCWFSLGGSYTILRH